MHKRILFAWAVLSLLTFTIAPFTTPHTAFAQGAPASLAAPAGLEIPAGFYLINSAPGVELYRKDYPNGTPDYVQVIDLSQGAAVVPLHGGILEPRSSKGVYGGADPRLQSLSLEAYWNQYTNQTSSPFCVTNGQFFYALETPTRLPFPLKSDGEIVSDGYGIKDFPDQKLMLEIWSDRANISPLSGEALYASSAPNIIAGLSEEANKRAKKSVGRTFTGVADRDGDNLFETILILNTLSSTQSDAAEVLRNFGAAKVMMLDGGGSTQLLCEGKSYIDSDRPIPQALGIAAAPSQGAQAEAVPAEAVAAMAAAAAPPPAIQAVEPLNAAILSQPAWPVISEGERLEVKIEVQNSGQQGWKAGEMELVLEKNLLGDVQRLPLEADTPAGEKAVFTYAPEDFTRWGVFTAAWSLQRAGERFPEQAQKFGVVVLPKQLKDRRAALEERLQRWNAQDPAEVEQLALNYIHSELNRSVVEKSRAVLSAPLDPLKVDLENVVWIPLAMLPVAAVVLVTIQKVRRHA